MGCGIVAEISSDCESNIFWKRRVGCSTEWSDAKERCLADFLELHSLDRSQGVVVRSFGRQHQVSDAVALQFVGHSAQDRRVQSSSSVGRKHQDLEYESGFVGELDWQTSFGLAVVVHFTGYVSKGDPSEPGE